MWEPAVTFGSADLLKWLPDHIRARNRTGLWISGYDKSRFLRKIEIRGRATVVHVGGLSGNNAVTWCLGSLRAENDNIEPSRRTGAASLIISTLDSLNTCFCIFIPDCTHTHTHARARTHTRTQAVKSKASRREAVSLRASVCVCVCIITRPIHEKSSSTNIFWKQATDSCGFLQLWDQMESVFQLETVCGAG